ncbi:cysteinyl-tRNA synthetase [Streptomyces glaucescens]|uniref:Cysteinyl-tRNA synthetase n=1 Tax=Streptomyces glaucescens TaxID=1907 RepID=A0A089X019_STRGA|nr:cysteinyl-tRNA synthetase [Streptomyces glaucescens]AIR97067.1 hypothetical protein SGLAU_05205 [Streptomyces glaucescens]
MLRIIDAGTGEVVEAAPARRGLTRVEAHAPGLDPTALRVLLVADVLVRALELGGTPVWGLLSAEDRRTELRAAAGTLGVRPLEDRAQAGPGPGERQVLHVVAEGAEAPDGVRVGVAAVEPARPPHAPGDGARALLNGDPAVLRLALLARRRGEPARLDPEALAAAGRTLGRWRRAVAGWAREPSRPVPEEVRGRLRAAWEDDLDVPGVLRVLRWVESEPELPDGARFETYVYADRLLGLDLARDLGVLA